MPKQRRPEESLKGWAAIAKFLSQPVSTAQRRASEGMPVRRIGRYVEASQTELERWLTREAGTKQTVHITTGEGDLLADLKRGLSEAREVAARVVPKRRGASSCHGPLRINPLHDPLGEDYGIRDNRVQDRGWASVVHLTELPCRQDRGPHSNRMSQMNEQQKKKPPPQGGVELVANPYLAIV